MGDLSETSDVDNGVFLLAHVTMASAGRCSELQHYSRNTYSSNLKGQVSLFILALSSRIRKVIKLTTPHTFQQCLLANQILASQILVLLTAQ